MPSLEQVIADIPDDAPQRDSTVYQPRAGGVAVAELALSAE